MRLSRRDALRFATLSVPRLAAAQALEFTNRTGVRIAPHANGAVPALDVFLPGAGSAAAVIEMPEHAWRRARSNDEPRWFYRMYTRDPQVQGRTRWARQGSGLSYRMELPSGVTMSARATLDDSGVTIDYEIANPDKVAFDETQAPTCIKLYRPFTDVFLERTWVHHPDGLELLASETPERLSKNAEEWLPCRYVARRSTQTSPANRVERQPDGITRYTKLRAVDAAFLATESSPAGWVAATLSRSSPDVWTNPARTCHHADAGAPLPARGSAKLSLKLYLLRGSVSDAWRTVGV